MIRKISEIAHWREVAQRVHRHGPVHDVEYQPTGAKLTAWNATVAQEARAVGLVQIEENGSRERLGNALTKYACEGIIKLLHAGIGAAGFVRGGRGSASSGMPSGQGYNLLRAIIGETLTIGFACVLESEPDSNRFRVRQRFQVNKAVRSGEFENGSANGAPEMQPLVDEQVAVLAEKLAPRLALVVRQALEPVFSLVDPDAAAEKDAREQEVHQLLEEMEAAKRRLAELGVG